MRVNRLILVALCLSASAKAATTNHWKLDDNAASTTVVATTGTNATLLGGDNTSAKQATGPGGQAAWSLDFNGADDAIDISGSSISIAGGSPLSFACWFNVDSLTNAHFLGRNADANVRVVLAGATVVRVRCNGQGMDFTVPTISTGTWYFLLVTKSAANNWRVFLNGVESSTAALSNAGTFDPDRLASSQGVNFMNGKLAWVKTFDSDESANVATLYAEGTGRLLLRLMLESVANIRKHAVWSLAA